MQKINWRDEKKKAYWKNIILFRWDKLIQKRDKYQWVFGGREGKNFDDNSRHLFEWVNKNHPELKTAWLCRTQELADEIRSLGYRAYAFGTKEADEYAKHAGVAFYSHELIDFGPHPRVGGATIATTGHGSGIPYVEGFKQKLAEAATAEGFYEYTMYLVFSMLNVYVRTQVKCAGGRVDMVVWMPDTVYVFELKVNDTAENALKQIDEKGYAIPYQTDNQRVIKVGVRFDKETRIPVEWVVG